MTDKTPEERIEEALDVAYQYGTIDGAHHKMWVLDQMVRTLTTESEYAEFIDDGEWDEGIPP